MIIRQPELGDKLRRPGQEEGQEPRMTYFWTWFNVLTMGLVDGAKKHSLHHDEEEMREEEANIELNMATLESARTCLLTMREAAYAFVKEDAKSGPKWSLLTKETKDSKEQLADIGLFFHCYPHCSVNSLHLHIVDLSEVGPTYAACSHKNLPMDMVLTALDKEIKEFKDVKASKSGRLGVQPRSRRGSREF